MVYNDLRSKLNEYNWDDGFEIPLSKVQKYKLQKKGSILVIGIPRHSSRYIEIVFEPVEMELVGKYRFSPRPLDSVS